MDLNHLANIEDLQGLNIDIMFAAVPKHLVADVSKKYNKLKTKNLFFVIFGVLLKESGQYIIFSSVFKSLKNKNAEGQYFKDIMVDSVVYEDKQEVLNYIYDFIDDFENHERIINEEITQLGEMPVKEAFIYLLDWNKGVFDYFNEYIKNKNNKKK